MGTDPQQLFGAGSGLRAAARGRPQKAFALEKLHPDGRRWVTLRRFPTKGDAERALDELLSKGHEGSGYRIRKVR